MLPAPNFKFFDFDAFRVHLKLVFSFLGGLSFGLLWRSLFRLFWGLIRLFWGFWFALRPRWFSYARSPTASTFCSVYKIDWKLNHSKSKFRTFHLPLFICFQIFSLIIRSVWQKLVGSIASSLMGCLLSRKKTHVSGHETSMFSMLLSRPMISFQRLRKWEREELNFWVHPLMSIIRLYQFV